ncbi:MAG: hypothetical protein ACE37F_03865 [Nannocystaceae bacterium]|nr:hypothetical protein [bacterium]
MVDLRPSLLLSLALALACGSSDPDTAGETDADTDPQTSMSGTSEAPTTGPGGGSTSTTADGTTTDDTAETTDAEEGSSSSSGGADDSSGSAASCQVWAITYDLTGSTFEISGTPVMAGDQLNTVMEPYDQDDHVGPGQFVLHFEDVDGAPGGLASMVSYAMEIFFVVDGLTTVTTDISGSAGPEECGVTQGLVQDGTVAWAPPQIVDYTSEGTVLCEGALCSAGGLPDGEPVDMGGTTDQPVNAFVFNDDFSAFTMDEVIINMDATSTQAWTYSGTEVARELVDAPACACQ